jgi:hypothetical protein
MQKVLHSYDFLINNSWERIFIGKNYDKNLKLYTKSFIEEMIYYFEIKEEYEKCQFLKEYISKRFDHEKNYRLQ